MSISSDFEKTRDELGGTNEDLELIQNVDFSGSEYEDDNAVNDNSLQTDVEQMWAELNKSQGGKKTKFEDSAAKPTKSKKEPAAQPAEPKPKDSKQDPLPVKEPKVKAKKPEEKKASAPVTKIAKPAKPQGLPNIIPKKDRFAWQDYLKTLNHPRKELLVDINKQWVEIADADFPHKGASVQYTEEILAELKTKAHDMLYSENSLFFEQRSKDRDFTNSLDFLKNGTYSDQLGTLSILSTESPLHTIRFIENMYSKCQIKNRESACKALEVLKDLIVSHVLPDRKLRWFRDQPLSPNVPLDTLISWSFEDFIKDIYFKLLQTMERLLSDTVESIRLRTLLCVFDLLQKKPEQEANLLRLGLNKFGDPSGKVASRLKRLIMDLLQVHPNMKTIFAVSIGDLLRGSSDYRVRYYAVDTLSEFILSRKDPELANQLIYTYLNLFERLMAESKYQKDERKEPEVSDGKPKSGKRFRPKRGKKGGIRQEKVDESEAENQRQASLVSKIFTGLNRAFPFSNLDASLFAKHTDTLYHMSHSPNVSTLIESLSFIFQLLKSSPSIGADRYFRALYDSLLDDRLMHSSKLVKYVILLLRSTSVLSSPAEVGRACAFVKRILQVATSWSEIGAIACLVHTAGMTPHIQKLLVETEAETETETEAEAETETGDSYDEKQRDPRYAKAETSKAWELVLLQRHFHPTVALYASNVLAPESEKQSLDLPDIEQYSVNNFLSKWSYKKPKAREVGRGNSIFQPLSGFTDISLGIRQQNTASDLPASVQDWKNKNINEISPDDQFLYNYFIQRPDKKVKEPVEHKEGSDSDDSENEDGVLNEDEINEAMSRSAPGEYGEDINFDGMDSDLQDDDDDDLEEGLTAAFQSSSDEGGNDSEGEDNSDGGFDDDEDLANAFEDDEFAHFDEMPKDAGEDAENNEDDSNKRKRKRNSYPTFLDADSFAELYAKEAEAKGKNKKSRK